MLGLLSNGVGGVLDMVGRLGSERCWVGWVRDTVALSTNQRRKERGSVEAMKTELGS